MSLTMFYEHDDSGSLVLDEHNQSVIRHRPESKTLADVLLVTHLHAQNPAMHYVIDCFVGLYAVTLQWDWFEKYQAWLVSKAEAELNAPTLSISAENTQTLLQPLFAEFEPVRPVIKTINQYRAEILIDGISIDEYLFRTQRALAVDSITIAVDGLVFDGDEDSQRRMLAAIHASDDAGINSTIWRLANNTEIAVTVEQIRNAHSLAIIEQGKLWTKGGPNA